MRQRCSGIRGGTSHKTLLLILTLDSYLHTPAKLLIGQLLGFRSGPAQRENRDGLQPSMGDFGNACTLFHLPEVFAKLIWHKQVGEKVQSFGSNSASVELRLRKRREMGRRREVWHERNNGFLEPTASSHLIQYTSYGKKWIKQIRNVFLESHQQKQSSQSAAKGKLECCRDG